MSNNGQSENNENNIKEQSKMENKDLEEEYIYQNAAKIEGYIVLKELGQAPLVLCIWSKMK